MIGSTHPDFPVAWTASVAALARAHALEGYPKEVAGIVVNGDYIRLDNISPNPESEVALSDEALLQVSDHAEIFFHSHPDIGCPSAADMIYQQQLAIPFVVLSIPEMDMFCFGDQCERAPLLNRGFRHGVHDCYALIRDWYAERRTINLWNKPRDWEWWAKGENLYVDNFLTGGFYEISSGIKPEPGDVWLFQFNYKVPMHGGLIDGDGMLFHHPAAHRGVDRTRLSARVPRQRYVHLASMRLRYGNAP